MGGKKCESCQSGQFWIDTAGNEHCETCSPPISELFVVTRTDYSTQVAAESSPPPQCPPPPSPAATPPPIVTPEPPANTSIFTDGQWWAAADRMLAKLSRREQGETRKESQGLTDHEQALITWARTTLGQFTNGDAQPAPIRMAPHHTIPDPAYYLTQLLRHFDAFLSPPPPGLPARPPDFTQRLQDLEQLKYAIQGT